MESPVQIRFKDMPASAQVERLCRAEAEKLERYHGRITACHVCVSCPHQRHRKGNHYHVRVDLVIPGSELVVDRTPAEHASHETLALAVREAFDAARRRLEDATRRMRGDVKTHTWPPTVGSASSTPSAAPARSPRDGRESTLP